MLLLILQSLSKWLEIKAVRAHWDLTKDIEAYCDHYEDEIIRARNDGNDAAADRMRARLSRTAGIAIPSIGSVATDARAIVPSAGK